MGANATKLLASLQTAYEDDPSKVNKLVEKIFTMFDKDKSGWCMQAFGLFLVLAHQT